VTPADPDAAAAPAMTAARLALASIGGRLRDAGLTARALAAWAGTARIAALPGRLDAMPPRPATPAAAFLALFVAGTELRLALAGERRPARLDPPSDLVDALIAHGLVERAGDLLRARVAILPVGPALVVCDRRDAPVERDRVCWPDDSSHHLATAIPPGRRGTWLDLGCGSAFAPLARPELAARICGIDLNERAVRYAQLGAGLSGIAHVEASPGDIASAHEAADLVTCNAPMPAASMLAAPAPAAPMPAASMFAAPTLAAPTLAAPTLAAPTLAAATLAAPRSAAPLSATAPAAPMVAAPPAAPMFVTPAAVGSELWQRAEPGFFERLWPALARAVRPGGMIVVHAACEVILPALASGAGERVVVTYTPVGAGGFAVAWWRPDAPHRFVAAHRALTPDRPHLDPRDREDALSR
jgi:SAM-dependent methyltransferase